MLKVSRQIFASHIRTGQVLPSSAVLHRKFQCQWNQVDTSDKIFLKCINGGPALTSSLALHTTYQWAPCIRMYSSATDDMSYNLTKHEAVTFLENVLGIPDPVSFVNKDKVAFLQELIRQTKLKIPFTNIVHFRQEEFINLTLDEFKQAIFKREGGNCMALNTFTSAVLQCLGFDTYLIGGSAYRWKAPLYNNHTAVIAKHLTTSDSLHFLDVGSPYFFPLISLDFDRISQVYHTTHSQYRFFQVSPGVTQLTRKCEPPIPGQTASLIYVENDDCWEVLTTFRISTPRTLTDCYDQNEVMRDNPELAPEATGGFFLTGYPDDLFISIVNNRCMMGTKTGQTEVTKMKSSTQIIEIILKYFPQYSRSHLESMADFFAKRSHKENKL